jgi:hypothetical protein
MTELLFVYAIDEFRSLFFAELNTVFADFLGLSAGRSDGLFAATDGSGIQFQKSASL